MPDRLALCFSPQGGPIPAEISRVTAERIIGSNNTEPGVNIDIEFHLFFLVNFYIHYEPPKVGDSAGTT